MQRLGGACETPIRGMRHVAVLGPAAAAHLVVLLQALAGQAAVRQGQGEVQVAPQLVARLGLLPRQQLAAQAQRQAGQANLERDGSMHANDKQ